MGHGLLSRYLQVQGDSSFVDGFGCSGVHLNGFLGITKILEVIPLDWQNRLSTCRAHGFSTSRGCGRGRWCLVLFVSIGFGERQRAQYFRGRVDKVPWIVFIPGMVGPKIRR